MDENDRSLWERWRRQRDEGAFEALVRPHLAFAVDFARRIGCSPADADDVVQQSLTLLVQERGARPAEVGVRAWLGRSVSLQARMLRRSEGRRARRERAAPLASATVADALESRDEVQAALAALPPMLREAVVLRHLHDLEYGEMAHVLGVSVNACRIRVHKGLEELRAKLRRHAGAELALVPLLGGVPGADLLRPALAATPPLGAAALLGGLLAVKKLTIALAVAALAAVGFLVHRSGALGRAEPAPARGTEARAPAAPAPRPGAAAPAPPEAPPAVAGTSRGQPTLAEELLAKGARLSFDPAESYRGLTAPVRWYANGEELPAGAITGVSVADAALGPLVQRLDGIPTLCWLQLFGEDIDGEDLAVLARLPALEGLHLGRSGLSDEGMPYVGRLVSLRALALHNTKVTDEGLAHLEGLPQLRVLDVHDLRITDEGLAHVGKLAALEELRLGETRITDEGLRHLSNLSLRRLDLEKGTISGAGVRHLDLSRLEELTFEEAPRVDDAALEALRGAKALRRLNLEESAVTDAGLAHLAACTALEWLDVDHTRVTDKGVAHLAALPSLRALSIEDTFVTDAAIEHFQRMRSLKRLEIGDTRITPDGLARLRAALPGCEVKQ